MLVALLKLADCLFTETSNRLSAFFFFLRTVYHIFISMSSAVFDFFEFVLFPQFSTSVIDSCFQRFSPCLCRAFLLLKRVPRWDSFAAAIDRQNLYPPPNKVNLKVGYIFLYIYLSEKRKKLPFKQSELVGQLLSF